MRACSQPYSIPIFPTDKFGDKSFKSSEILIGYFSMFVPDTLQFLSQLYKSFFVHLFLLLLWSALCLVHVQSFVTYTAWPKYLDIRH